MIANYNLKLGKLALIQESIKGFPQGFPKVAEPYLSLTGLDENALVMGAGESAATPESVAKLGMEIYGKLVKRKKGGALDKYQTGRQVTPGLKDPDDEYNFAKNYGTVYEMYKKALQSDDLREIQDIRKLIEQERNNLFTNNPFNTDKKFSLSIWPTSDSDKFQDLQSILTERQQSLRDKTRLESRNKSFAEADEKITELNSLLERIPEGNFKERLEVENAIRQLKKNKQSVSNPYAYQKKFYTPDGPKIENNYKKIPNYTPVSLNVSNQGTVDSLLTTYSKPSEPLNNNTNQNNQQQQTNTPPPANQNRQSGTSQSTGTSRVRVTQAPDDNSIVDKEAYQEYLNRRKQSLPQQKYGGDIPKYQIAGQTEGNTSNKKVVFTDGVYAEYSDGSVVKKTDAGDVIIKKPYSLKISPYKGKDAPSKYSQEEWNEFAQKLGFVPSSNDPKQQAIEFQRFLYNDPKWGPKVKELHTKYGMPKAGTEFDGLLGKRWDNIFENIKPETPKTEEPKLDVNTQTQVQEDPLKVITEGYRTPAVYNQPGFEPWWIQDVTNFAGAAGDYLTREQFPPKKFTTPVEYAEPTFYDPNRELAANTEAANMLVQNLGQFAGPQALSSRASQIAGQTAKNAADILGRYNTMNVGTANQFEQGNRQTANIANQMRTAQEKQFFDESTVFGQQDANEKRALKWNLINMLNNGLTNAAYTGNINDMFDNYRINPWTGGRIAFDKERAMKANAQYDPLQQKLNEYERLSKVLPNDVDRNKLWESIYNTKSPAYSGVDPNMARLMEMMSGMYGRNNPNS